MLGVIIYFVGAAAPETCTTKSALSVLTEPSKTGKKQRLPKGSTLTLTGEDPMWAEVSTPVQGFITRAALKRGCSAPVAVVAPEPVAPLQVAAPAVPLPEPTPVPAPAPVPPPPPPAKPRAKSSDAGKVKVAVMDLRGAAQIPKELTDSLTALIPQTLDELGPFKAITKQDIEQMLALERIKDAVGCSDVSCLAEIGGALGADYLVSGGVVLVGDTYLVQLQLLNIRTARAEQRVSREYKGGPQGLFEEMRVATKLVVREILAQRSGKLELSVSEEGATVRIDGSIIGTSPLKALSVSGGIHTLMVEREGFVRYNEDIQIRENESTQVRVDLLPSEDFKRGYTSRARTTRALAWTFSAAGVAAIAGGAVWLVVNNGQGRQLASEVDTFNAQDTRTQTEIDGYNSRKSALTVYDGLAIGTMAIGGILGAVGVALFVVGDSPSKYDATTSTSVTVSLTGNGLRLSGAF